MDIKTFRATSMQQALAMVRRELGPDAAVLHTRKLKANMVQWFTGSRTVEVVASATVHVPSRLTSPEDEPAVTSSHVDSPSLPPAILPPPSAPAHSAVEPQTLPDYRAMYRRGIKEQIDTLQSMVEDLCGRAQSSPGNEMSESMFRLYTDLIEAELSETLARELVERVRVDSPGGEIDDPMLAKAHLARMIEKEIHTSGPVVARPGQRRLVALVGPTGVGKTTTIAKLAANFRLRDKLRVGLITVDTYRIAAVEQLRTYADIMDLPMEVVSTPREMRAAVNRLEDMDIVLMDTAGRSPRDDIKIQELKSMLAEAAADEVHLVLSSVGSATALRRTAEMFAPVGTTSLILTKLDEATGLGNLLPLLRGSKLPLSYLTNGQNVPDDIQQAEGRKLAKVVLGMEA